MFPFKYNYIELYNFLSEIDNKKFFVKAIFFIIFFAIIESFGIFGLLPFLALLENPDLITENVYIKYFYELIDVNDYQKFILYFGILIFFFIVISSLLGAISRYLLIYVTSDINEKISKLIVKTFLSNNLENLKIIDHTKIVSTLYQETDRFTDKFITNIINIFKNILIIILISILIFFRDIYIGISVLIFYSIIFFSILYIFRGKSLNISLKISENNQNIIKYTTNALRGIKFIFLKRLQFYIYDKLKYEIRFKKKLLDLQGIINSVSKSLIEISVFGPLIFFSILIVYIYNYQSLVTNLIFFGFCAYRVLPAVQQTLLSVNITNHHYSSFKSIIEMTNLKSKNITFERLDKLDPQNSSIIDTIKINEASFNYLNNVIFEKCNLILNKGNSYLISGKSGIGKSTLIDLILGITKPKNGNIEINNKNVNSKEAIKLITNISYLPQNIFLFRDTIENNILLDRDKNYTLLEDSIKISNLTLDINNRDNGIQSILSDNNEAVSGGQAQRINIARALYDYPSAIILDEPTSSLDNINSNKILKKILNKYKDLIILCISHDENVINLFDYIITIDDNKIKMRKQKTTL